MAKIEDVIEYLRQQERAKPSADDTHVVMKCPVCGDPTRTTSANFSISVDTTNNKKFLYQCFRADCAAKGYLTPEKMKKFFGCDNLELLLAMATYNNEKYKNKKGYHSSEPINFYKELNIRKFGSKIAKRNVAYINKRLGTDFSEKDLCELRIIPDINFFIKDNKLKIKENFDPDRCVGFLSAKSNILVCRNLKPIGNESRYFNITLKKLEDDISKYYILPLGVDFTDVSLLMNPEPIEIHIAEGIFSILGAYHYNLSKGKYKEGSIYIANNGSGYAKTLIDILKMHGFTKVNINIYADTDLKDGKIDKKKFDIIFKYFNKEIILNEFNLKYNKLKEDFGYPSKNIDIKEFRYL